MLATLIKLCQARVAHERVRRAAGFPMHPLSSPALRDHRSGGGRRRRGRGGPGAFFTLVKKSKSKEHPWVQNRSCVSWCLVRPCDLQAWAVVRAGRTRLPMKHESGPAMHAQASQATARGLLSRG